jgi:hypothetical protein
MIHVAVINESTALTDAQVQAMIPAFETQWNRDLAPVWNVEQVQFVWNPKTQPPPPSSWWVLFLDDSDQADSLAYHEKTDTGQPIAKVFVKTIQARNASVSIKATHEICEMAVDPSNHLAVQDGEGAFWACEICDPVDSDEHGYEINGVPVSDFVTPAWFGMRSGTAPFDFRQHVTAAFQVLPGGYAQKLGRLASSIEVPQETGWTQINAEAPAAKKPVPHAPPGSRRHRRVKPRHEWKPSESFASRNARRTERKPRPDPG